MRKIKINFNYVIMGAGILAVAVLLAFGVWLNNDFEVASTNHPPGTSGLPSGPVGALTGLSCEHWNRRPVAVMLASDAEARPLTGVSGADMVFEMPVAPNGITRMMAVYQCGDPEEIGSVRSARGDFIPLAAGVGAILAHWGGEREALNLLNKGIINNIDAMKFDGSVFYRKKKVPQPHNGFTTLDLLFGQAEKFSYAAENSFAGYRHTTESFPRTLSSLAPSVTVGYPVPFDVVWAFDESARAYRRTRAGIPETDKLSGDTVLASAIVVMETTSKVLSDQYVSVNVVGQGRATVYQDGVAISATWKKADRGSSRLEFLDAKNGEIKFIPGVIWVEIVTK